MVTRYLFYSHDGYGLGHVRRNSLIAQAVLETDPTAHVTLVTGLGVRPRWLQETPRVHVHRVPPLLKSTDGSYRHEKLSFEDAVRERERIFAQLVEDQRPDVVVVDRHPYGTAGELRAGLDIARSNGSALVLGLRDVLDEPSVVRQELAGLGWADVENVYDDIFVYGQRHFVDHEQEYGLQLPLTYCGWVVESAPRRATEPNLLAVAAGGGGDGAAVFELGARLIGHCDDLVGLFAPGPYAGADAVRRLAELAPGRARIVSHSDACGEWFSRAEAILCMSGYNSTLEALAAGRRPILLPRRTPRREQAIRAERLQELGLADVVDAGTDIDEVAELVRRPRLLPPGAVAAAGMNLDGAHTAARRLHSLTSPRVVEAAETVGSLR
ncbi:MAG: glycosyltransferase family protein [Nocardioidaceae bacterium]